jgi:spore germination cell wall hydrolase CwlJ-like protein
MTCRWRNKATLAALLVIASPLAATQTAMQCKGMALHVESRGEPLAGSKAVLQVIHNRMRIRKKSACQIIFAKGQFPWAKNIRSWRLTKAQVARYNVVVAMAPVVSRQTYYFNYRPMKWGVFCCKIGGQYFYYRKMPVVKLKPDKRR